MKKPKLGQVFLHDQNIIDKIIRYATIHESDHLVEIGCGAGILTSALLQFPNLLTVIEIDDKCIQKTQSRLGSDADLTFIHQDVLDVDFSVLSTPITVVANIPYYLSSKLIQRFVAFKSCFSSMMIMIQQEFAEKCIAKPLEKSYTSLTVYTQLHFDVDYLFPISRHCFDPIPNVDSAMIRLTPKDSIIGLNYAMFEKIVKAAFWGKRKKCSTCLNQNPFIQFTCDVRDIDSLSEWLHKRPDQLSLDEYKQLVNGLLPYVNNEDKKFS